MESLPKTWNRVLKFFFSITVLFIIVFYVVLSALIIIREQYEYKQDAEKKVENVAYNVNRELNAMYDVSESVSKSVILHDVILNKDTKSEYYEEYIFVKRFFESFTNYSNAELKFCIYPIEASLPENMYIENISRLKSNKKLSDMLFNMEHNDTLWYETQNNKNKNIYIYRGIVSQGNVIGYLETGISLGFISEIMGEVDLNNNEILELISNKKEKLYSRGKENKKANILFERDLMGEYKIRIRCTKDSMYRDCYIYIALITIFIIVLLVVCYFLYATFIRKQLGAFYKFIYIIEDDEQKLLQPESIVVDGDSDILRIVERFKQMVVKLNNMHLNLENINKEKKRIELKMQQSSINPHLLYNSLSVLNWRMKEHNDDEMTSLINYMVQYYRNVLSNGEIFITIENEINMIKQYLEIIRLAYDQSFDVEINVENDIKDAYTIKQVLQPIVENAVMHGLRNVKDAKLIINVFGENDKIVFVVQDNGRGMSQEEIKAVLSDEVRKGGIVKNRGYGVKNIRECTKYFYGTECGVDINSNLGEGTTVNITIKNLSGNEINEMI